MCSSERNTCLFGAIHKNGSPDVTRLMLGIVSVMQQTGFSKLPLITRMGILDYEVLGT